MATMHSPPIKAPVTQIISGKLLMITHLPKGRSGRGNKIILQVPRPRKLSHKHTAHVTANSDC